MKRMQDRVSRNKIPQQINLQQDVVLVTTIPIQIQQVVNVNPVPLAPTILRNLPHHVLNVQRERQPPRREALTSTSAE